MTTYTVKDLLQGKLPDIYRDKVFWFAERVIQTDDSIDLYINNLTGLTAFDNVAEELHVTPLSELAALPAPIPWNSGEKPVLVSSGSFLWVNGKLLITQRTADAKYDPSAWTTPAGRCDDTPYRTALKETIEEIHIHSTNSDKLWMPEMAKEFIPYNSSVDLYNANPNFPKEINESLTTVKFFIDDQLIEKSMLWLMFSPNSNTIELRLPLSVEIDENIYYSNPEFHTPTQTMSISEIKAVKVVPALERLIMNIKP